MSLRAALLVAITVFVVTLLARLPARAVVSLLPANVSCEAPGGTIWHGSCGQLRGGPLTLNGISWTVHPGALLSLHLSAEVSSSDARAAGHASIDLSPNQQLDIHSLSAQLDLHGGLAVLPRGLEGSWYKPTWWRSAATRPVARAGGLDTRVLQRCATRWASQADLGSFELQFAPAPQAAPIDGQLRDLGWTPIGQRPTATPAWWRL